MMTNNGSDYIWTAEKQIKFRRTDNSLINLPVELFIGAISQTHKIIDEIDEVSVDIFSILGLRNMSAFVGEVFATAFCQQSPKFLIRNPHQDGYPDILIMDSLGKAEWDSLDGRRDEKGPFSPFTAGGIEVKATIGSVPSPMQCRAKAMERPAMGDRRIDVLKGYDWKAHHRETNNLAGIMWDFIDGKPRLTGIFFSSSLVETDWGKIVQPKDGGGRTTSVSIMTRLGVKLMYDGWIAVLNDARYVDFLDRYNKDTKLKFATTHG